MQQHPGSPHAERHADQDGAIAQASDRVAEEIARDGLTAERLSRWADAFEREGRFPPAIQALTTANRLQPNGAIERRLVRLRRAAYGNLDFSFVPAQWPHFPLDTDEPTRGLLEIDARDFNARALKIGVLRHGHLLVRGLLTPAQVDRLRSAIDSAYEARASATTNADAESTRWFDPLEGLPDGEMTRIVVRELFGLLTADSPRGLFELLEVIHELGLDRMIESYFGERPAVSVKKCTLRKISGNITRTGWHQDGSFLGESVRTVNFWTSLSHCGSEAPGLEIVPLRLNRLLEQRNDGSPYSWGVAEGAIEREFPGLEIARPELSPGDVMFFDHYSVHRTALWLKPPKTRYAVECWFFAPSTYLQDPSELLVL